MNRRALLLTLLVTLVGCGQAPLSSEQIDELVAAQLYAFTAYDSLSRQVVYMGENEESIAKLRALQSEAVPIFSEAEALYVAHAVEPGREPVDDAGLIAEAQDGLRAMRGMVDRALAAGAGAGAVEAFEGYEDELVATRAALERLMRRHGIRGEL